MTLTMKEMSFLDHLQEFRSTIVRILIVLVCGFSLAYSFSEYLSEFLLQPLRVALQADGGQIVYLGLLDKMLSQFEISFYSGAILSSPFWFYEIWRFIRPGLHVQEVRAVRPFIISGFVLFWLGVCFGHFVVFPLTFETILSFGVSNVNATIDLKTHLALMVKVLLFLGLIFQLPNILVILSMIGIVNRHSLREKQRYVMVILAVAAAILTPPDVVTMMAVWIPMCVLYEIGIWAVTFVSKASGRDNNHKLLTDPGGV